MSGARETRDVPPTRARGGLVFIGGSGNLKRFLYLRKKKSTAKMAIDTGSDDDDSCRTTKILTVYVGLVGTGKKGPVTGDKAVHNDEL